MNNKVVHLRTWLIQKSSLRRWQEYLWLSWNCSTLFYECNTYNIIRNRTIATLTVLTNVEIVLSGCPLYDNDANEEIFAQGHNFIINILIKWQYNMPTYLCNKLVHNMHFCRWPVVRSSVDGRRLPKCRPTVVRLSADERPMVYRWKTEVFPRAISCAYL